MPSGRLQIASICMLFCIAHSTLSCSKPHYLSYTAVSLSTPVAPRLTEVAAVVAAGYVSILFLHLFIIYNNFHVKTVQLMLYVFCQTLSFAYRLLLIKFLVYI